MGAMNLPATQKPHVPTLVSAAIVILVLLVIYHLAMGAKRR